MEFQRRFPDEAICRAYLFDSRWPEGFRCPRCGSQSATALPRRLLWQCSTCRYQASVTAGTVLHRTRTPLHLWFWGAYLVTTATPGISALQLQRGDPRRRGRHQIRTPEPQVQRSTGPVQHRACSHRSLVPARGALPQQPPGQRGSTLAPAAGTPETLWPARVEKVCPAYRLIGKATLELHDRPREVWSCHAHPLAELTG